MVWLRSALMWCFAAAIMVGLDHQVTESQNNGSRRGMLEVIWSNTLVFRMSCSIAFPGLWVKLTGYRSLSPSRHSWKYERHFLSFSLRALFPVTVFDQRLSRVALQWHLWAPSVLVAAPRHGMWTSICTVYLSIPWPNPLPPSMHLPCSSLSPCPLECGIPEPDQMRLCEIHSGFCKGWS